MVRLVIAFDPLFFTTIIGQIFDSHSELHSRMDISFATTGVQAEDVINDVRNCSRLTIIRCFCPAVKCNGPQEV